MVVKNIQHPKFSVYFLNYKVIHKKVITIAASTGKLCTLLCIRSAPKLYMGLSH